MAVSIFDENAPHDGTEFFPFDDSRSAATKRAGQESSVSRDPMDTRGFDAFRQGVEITTEPYRFAGPGPKIWAGNIKGYSKVRTIGQSVSFTDFENSIAWEELPRFNPVSFIQLGDAYPRPIVFNEGPQQNKEAGVQPLTIPFRSPESHVEFVENAHAIRGNVEDGNSDNRKQNGANSRIEQFIDLKESTDLVPFLDDGVEYFGTLIPTSIVVPAFLNDGDATITPFDDVGDEQLVNQLNTSDTTFLTVLRSSSSINLDEDLRQTHGIRSATAGADVYGPSQGRYGTDSVAFAGYFRGS
jgi:hypothetical protein